MNNQFHSVMTYLRENSPSFISTRILAEDLELDESEITQTLYEQESNGRVNLEVRNNTVYAKIVK